MSQPGWFYYNPAMVNMRRLLLLPSVLLLFGGILSARGGDEPAGEEKTVLRLLVPSGATLATVALLDDETADYELEIEVALSTDIIAARLISGDVDFAVIPTNLAAVLYNRGADIRMAGPSIWGLLYGVSSEELSVIGDLRGRTVNMIGRGLTPDITFRHLLRQNGLEPDVDVTLTYASGAAELAPAFLTGRSAISMMPEPMITTVLAKKPDTILLLDVQEAWREVYGTSYPQAGLGVSGAFADADPGVADAFISRYAAAVAGAPGAAVEVGAAAAALSEAMNPDIFAAAVPRMNLEFVPSMEARKALEDYYRVLEDFNPATIGGTLPSDDFYYR